MVYILHLHRKAPYPPSSGADRRVWESAKKFSSIGTNWLAAPWKGTEDIPDIPNIVDIDSIWLKNKVCRIYIWTLLTGVSTRPVDRWFERIVRNRVSAAGVDPDVIVSECPQLDSPAVTLADHFDAKLVLDKHNAEFSVVDQFLASKPVPDTLRRHLVARHRDLEQRAIDKADTVVFMSHEDQDPFDLSGTTTYVIPNGTDYTEFDRESHSAGDVFDFDHDSEQPLCVYVGAYDYEPNREAAKRIAHEIAPELPDIDFVLVGRNPPNINETANVHTTGFVDDLGETLSAADIALCPLSMGSGTKLKMLDYMAAGLPIITTPIGAEGLDVADEKTALIRETSTEFVEAIDRLSDDSELRATLGSNAKELGRDYDWNNLFETYDQIFNELLDADSQ